MTNSRMLRVYGHLEKMGENSFVRKSPTPQKNYIGKQPVDGGIILKNIPERQVLECAFYYVAQDKDKRWASVD